MKLQFNRPAADHPEWIPERCAALRAALSAYVDGELEAEQSARLLRHLEVCAGCSRRLCEFRQIGQQMRALPAPQTPAQLGLRLRIAASHYAARGQRWVYFKLRCSMLMEVLAVPAVVGTAAALFLFAALVGGVRGNIVNNASLPDVQLGNATPPRLTRAAGYDVGAAVLVQANIDATGHVYGYRVISGPDDAQMRARLNNQLLLSVFEPATTMFGQPTTGSLLVSFGSVTVRG